MMQKNEQILFIQRINQMLQLAEERGYNLTVEQLSSKLFGGAVPASDLRSILSKLNNIEVDHDFIATKGHLYLSKCQQRQVSNAALLPYYQRIADKFVREFRRLCPWVTCMLISGSMASEGLAEGDDIDFDLVVPDGCKYTTYLLALLLSFKYSLLHGKRFWRRYVICISVIWEVHQVLPFERRDGQVAFELLNAKCIYNPDFFSFLISKNEWLEEFFPLIFYKSPPAYSLPTTLLQGKKSLLTGIIEPMSKTLLFLMVHIAIRTIFYDHNIKNRMKVKHPYTIFDIP